MATIEPNSSESISENYSSFIQLSLPLMFCTLSYGAYLVLFVTCTYIITHRKGCVKKMQFIAIVALFVFATLGFIFSCIDTFLDIKCNVIHDFDSGYYQLELPFVMRRTFHWYSYHSQHNSKCYKIWGAKKKIIVFPIFISIVNNGLALVEFINMLVEVVKTSGDDFRIETSMARLEELGYATLKSFLAVNFFTNLLIPLMIAGRIWWIGHQVSKFLPKNKFHPTKHAMAVCLESGIMYPLALIPALVLAFEETLRLDTRYMDASSLIPNLIQVVGIAPTFIIDTIHMNERNGQNNQVLSMWEANRNIEECSQSEQSTA
ncbi:hypothetical protein K435DRAFT_797455 [Dendrothele bispora CBS 962.96]|uniref:Uncharacterized protein n=1 Tax=Dendrothele bispora (strain CBS 962.96) TaxID=1314807 RepID=A0A4S8M2I4_DENBC|nr:hypothetical protein K435DRAFT_797455 [Dendrothele bispora CBS 962.96]